MRGGLQVKLPIATIFEMVRTLPGRISVLRS